MPPPAESAVLDLHLQPKTFYLYQFSPSHDLSKQTLDLIVTHQDRFISITRTSEEISVVSDDELDEPQKGVRMSKWSCIRVQGPMELNLVGILNHLTLPLKDAKIPIFALSTWNTDYILIPLEHTTQAVEVLRQDGWVVHKRTLQT